MLENMIDADSVDDELEAEVADECSKFGRVAHVTVSVEQRDDSYEMPESSADDVRVFVEFTSQSGTCNCWLQSSTSGCLTLFVSNQFSGSGRTAGLACMSRSLCLWTITFERNDL